MGACDMSVVKYIKDNMIDICWRFSFQFGYLTEVRIDTD